MPTDRLSRSLPMLRGARVVRRLGLCTTPLGIAAVARNASCAPGYGGEALRCCSAVPRRWDECVSTREDTRAGAWSLQARPSKALRAPADTPHPPQGGFERAPQHNARIIMRTPLNAARRAALGRGLFGSRPHNVRYVEVPAQRAKTLAVRSREAPQISSPAHPHRGVRTRATVARYLQHRLHPLPQGAPCLVALRLGLRLPIARVHCTPRRMQRPRQPPKTALVTAAAIPIALGGCVCTEVLLWMRGGAR